MRAALTEQLSERLSEQRLRELHLLVSEVVNNSVVHGHVDEDGWIDVACSLDDDNVRIEVCDSGLQGQPRPRQPNFEIGGGFGLFLVESLSASWGVDHARGLTVWFELAVPGIS